MIVLGVPTRGQGVFCQARSRIAAKPIRGALAPMVLAFLLAPQSTLPEDDRGRGARTPPPCGHDLSPADQSRNGGRATGTWTLYDGLLRATSTAWERRQAKGKRRQWIVAIDTTYHATMSEQMENLIVMSKRQDPAAADDAPARLPHGAGADRPRRAAAAAAEELLHGRLLPQTSSGVFARRSNWRRT